jgi:hypothetical protein
MNSIIDAVLALIYRDTAAIVASFTRTVSRLESHAQRRFGMATKARKEAASKLSAAYDHEVEARRSTDVAKRLSEIVYGPAPAAE